MATTGAGCSRSYAAAAAAASAANSSHEASKASWSAQTWRTAAARPGKRSAAAASAGAVRGEARVVRGVELGRVVLGERVEHEELAVGHGGAELLAEAGADGLPLPELGGQRGIAGHELVEAGALVRAERVVEREKVGRGSHGEGLR